MFIIAQFDNKNVDSFSFRLPQIETILAQKLVIVKASATFSTLDCGFPREGKH